jgi:peptide/nickel transport system permease protein
VGFKLVILWTDVVMWALAVLVVGIAVAAARRPEWRRTWRRVFADAGAMAASVVLAACFGVALLDSVHYRLALPPAPGTPPGVTAYEPFTRSLLDAALRPLVADREATYSRPLAFEGFTKETVDEGGVVRRVAPRLEHGGRHLTDPGTQWAADVATRATVGASAGVGVAFLAWVLAGLAVARRTPSRADGLGSALRRLWRGDTTLPWRAALWTFTVLAVLAGAIAALAPHYHVFGTDRTGNDVLVQVLKSLRTAFVIGSLSTLATLPFAVGLGLAAGYFRGWVDEAVQYLYTVLSSVPNVLLIAALVLMIQVFLDTHPELFETGAERADLKLFLLCVVLGVTGWAGLCRLVRAETLKLRELEYVQAATAFGVGHARILARHLLPNVMHLVLITTVLDFSALVLYEAVLSYVGVGVDPTMNSFGGMINLARSEMSRDPVVWWSFAAAFVVMVALVLAANLFADGVQQAFDPRARVFRPRLSLRQRARSAS